MLSDGLFVHLRFSLLNQSKQDQQALQEEYKQDF